MSTKKEEIQREGRGSTQQDASKKPRILKQWEESKHPIENGCKFTTAIETQAKRRKR